MTAAQIQALRVGDQCSWHDQRDETNLVIVTVVQNGPHAVGTQVDPNDVSRMLPGEESYLGLKFPNDPLTRFFPVDRDFPALNPL